MRRRGLALMVLALMLVVMMVFAGIETARGASVGRQGPPEGKGPPAFTDELPAANIPQFGGCPPPP